MHDNLPTVVRSFRKKQDPAVAAVEAKAKHMNVKRSGYDVHFQNNIVAFPAHRTKLDPLHYIDQFPWLTDDEISTVTIVLEGKNANGLGEGCREGDHLHLNVRVREPDIRSGTLVVGVLRGGNFLLGRLFKEENRTFLRSSGSKRDQYRQGEYFILGIVTELNRQLALAS